MGGQMINQITSSHVGKHDVFISYAEADNQKTENTKDGWVDSFIDLLQKCLNRVLGLDDSCLVWTNHQLASNGPMTPDLVTKIESTPLFVIVLSPDYLRSEWCASMDGVNSEIPAFMKMVDSHVLDGQNRVFIIEKTEAPAKRPPEFDDAPLFRFWVKDRSDLEPRPFNASLEDFNFLDNLNDLAIDIARELRRLRRESQPSSESDSEVTDNESEISSELLNESRAKVFLAYAASNLNPLRKKVKRYLEQASLSVVPEMSLAQDSSKIRALVEKHLAESDLFVQLLSYATEYKLEGTDESLATFQYRRATEMGIPVMQWRNSELTAEEIENDIEDPDHRDLLLDSTVQAVNIEDFNRDVVNNAKPRKQRETVKLDDSNAYIFMNMKSPDRPAATELCDYLQRRGLQYTMVTQEGRPNEIRNELTTALLETDGMIVVYDDSKNEWVRSRLNEVRKILQLPYARCKELNPKLVYKSPPERRPHHGIQLKNMMVVDCAEGFDESKLNQFLEEVELNAEKRIQEMQQKQCVEKRDNYDVFLAHNSIDKPFVRQVYTNLKETLVHPWFDEQEIKPGRLFQKEIQAAILKCTTAAILIGKHGLGAWQELELQSLISLCIKNGLNIIPVLLPDVDEIPNDLVFLQQYHWVKFNDENDREALERFIVGIQS